MRALHFDGSAVRFRGDYPEPVAGAGEVVIRVAMAGVCQTDLEIARGYMGFTGVLGHEFVGVVERVGDGVDVAWIGRRVCAEINCVCGACAMCGRGLGTHCLDRTVIGILNHDGAFAEFVRAPVANLHVIPPEVSDEEAVFVEPLAAAFQILRQVRIEKATRVTVLGDGRLGQLVTQVMARAGCDLTLVGRHAEKLALAEALSRGRVRGEMDAERGERRAARDQDVVIDCTGRAAGFARALELVRPRGTVVMKTTVAPGGPAVNLAPIVIDEITVVGSRCGPFKEAVRVLAERAVTVGPLISRRVGLAEGAGMFAGGIGGIKTVLVV